MTVRVSRARHLRHRRLDGINRGAGVSRLRILKAWLTARAADASAGGIGDTGVTDEFVTDDIADTAASGVLTGTTIAADDTVTIGDVVYTFVAALTTNPGTVPYEVLVGVADTNSLDNLIAAVNGAAGAGTTYGTDTVAHPDVAAAAGAGDTIDFTAEVAGPDGNAIATTAALTAGDFGAETLEGGATAVESLTAAAHGLTAGDGPLLLTSTTTLPAGLAEDTLYWAGVVDVDTFTLHRSRKDAVLGINPVDATSAGTGTHTFARAADIPGLIEWLRQDNDPRTIQALDDIDDL